MLDPPETAKNSFSLLIHFFTIFFIFVFNILLNCEERWFYNDSIYKSYIL